MSYSEDVGRQNPVVAVATITAADIAADADGSINAITLPINAILLDLKVYVDTAFDVLSPHTTSQLDVGDGDGAQLFVAQATVSTTGSKTVTTTYFGKKYASGGVIKVAFEIPESIHTGVAGVVRVMASYVIDGRATECQAA